jgi:hypothetical protein
LAQKQQQQKLKTHSTIYPDPYFEVYQHTNSFRVLVKNKKNTTER